MSPTIVLKNGKPVLVTGSPGGSRIISAVTQIIVDVIDYKMDYRGRRRRAAPASSMLPDEVRIERGFPDDVLAGLRDKGHKTGRAARLLPRPTRLPSPPTACSARRIRARAGRRRGTMKRGGGQSQRVARTRAR